MSIYKILDRISDKYALFREENADLPKYLILDVSARQAIKLMASHRGEPVPDPVMYLGCKIIPYEEVIIIEEEELDE